MGGDTVEEAQVEKLITRECYVWAQVEDIFVLNDLNVPASKHIPLKQHKAVSGD